MRAAGTMLAKSGGMDYLFSEAGSRALDFAAIGPTLFAFDLDDLLGPDAPPLPDETRSGLLELSRTAPVAVISARERARVVDRLPEGLSYVIGRDGEGLPGSAVASKPEAVQALLTHSRCRTAVFVGAGAGDETVFESAPPHWLTVHVGAGEPSCARWFVNDEQELASLLRAILARRGH